MKVDACYLKPSHGLPMLEQASLNCRAGFGIVGAANPHAHSPRQVLVVDSEIYRDFNLRATTLRENLLVRGLDLKKLASGQVLAIGNEVLLRITIPCEPCVKLNRERKNLCKEIFENRGILARVIRSGKVQRGARIKIVDSNLPRLPDRMQDRIYELLKKVPAGKVITYNQITVFTGVHRSSVRMIPRLIRSSPLNLPVHRIVSTNCGLILFHIPNQRQLLSEECVEITERGFVVSECLWNDNPFTSDEKKFLDTKLRY